MRRSLPVNDRDFESRERCFMSAVQSNEAQMPAAGSYDVVVVGAGFAGLNMLHQLRGLGLTARVLRAG
jgi:cyclohexanone monooxygenase